MRSDSRWKKWCLLFLGGGSVTLLQVSCVEPALLVSTLINAAASIVLIRAVLQ